MMVSMGDSIATQLVYLQNTDLTTEKVYWVKL